MDLYDFKLKATIELLKIIPTFIIGCIAAYIAYQQWKISHKKLKYDLFERRFKIFEATKMFIVNIITCGGIGSERGRRMIGVANKYLPSTISVYFLFDQDIIDYVEECVRRVNEMSAHPSPIS